MCIANECNFVLVVFFFVQLRIHIPEPFHLNYRTKFITTIVFYIATLKLNLLMMRFMDNNGILQYEKCYDQNAIWNYCILIAFQQTINNKCTLTCDKKVFGPDGNFNAFNMFMRVPHVVGPQFSDSQNNGFQWKCIEIVLCLILFLCCVLSLLKNKTISFAMKMKWENYNLCVTRLTHVWERKFTCANSIPFQSMPFHGILVALFWVGKKHKKPEGNIGRWKCARVNLIDIRPLER